MEYFANKFFFLLLFIALCLSYSAQTTVAHGDKRHKKHNDTSIHGGADAELVSKACKHAPHKELCVTVLESDPNSHGADMRGLGLIALRTAASNASDIAEQVKVLFNDSGLDPAVQDGAAECLDHYLDAAEQLDDSIAALLADAHKDVEAWVNVAVTDANSCDSALAGHESVLGGKNDVFRRLCDNALAINKILDDGKN